MLHLSFASLLIICAIGFNVGLNATFIMRSKHCQLSNLSGNSLYKAATNSSASTDVDSSSTNLTVSSQKISVRRL